MKPPALRLVLLLAVAGPLFGCATGSQPAPLPPPVSPAVANPAPEPVADQPTVRVTDGRRRFDGVFGAIQAAGILAGNAGPASVNWIDGGERFSYTAVNPSTRMEEVRVYDPTTGEDEVIFTASSLRLPDGSPLTYDSFQWASDSRHVLFQTDFRPIYRRSGISDYYLYDLEDGDLDLVADDVRSAELSPDAGWIGYEQGGDLYALDMASNQTTRLTTSGSEDLFNGVFDWVYEEEFGIAEAWEWSPDGAHIAFWQTDESEVGSIAITDWSGFNPDFVEITIPKVGEPNPKVRIGVADVENGSVVWLDTGITEDHYIPRIYWTSRPNTLAVVTLNRSQNHVQLYFFDVTTGEKELVFEERSDTWIDVYDFFAGILHFFFFPEGLEEFHWISDRNGHQHIYRYDYDGNLLNQVTSGPWNVIRVEAVDLESRTIFYTSAEDSPLERQLYAVGFDGSGKRRVSEGRGRHRFDVSPNGEFYLDRWSNTQTPLQVELRSTTQGRLAVLEDNDGTNRWMEANAYSPSELFTFETSDGVRLDGSMVKPPGFEPTRAYPVVLSIYGGPGSQQVYDEFTSDFFNQYLAQQGYIVVGLNNRGTGNYGSDFMKIVYRRLGHWEANDFAEVGRWLASQPWVDGDRMAIMGTSYGGYTTIYTMLDHPDVFRLGIANSPGTDWRIYDSIYTERYMGLLSENADGYEGSSVMSIADNLEGHLLLVHSGMDENVQPRQTMQLITALTDAGKDAEFRFYPRGAHGAAYSLESFVLMQRVYEQTLCRFLKADCDIEFLNR
ncbi:MAG: S9 family peptidase [Gemmatimonadota bacterium]